MSGKSKGSSDSPSSSSKKESRKTIAAVSGSSRDLSHGRTSSSSSSTAPSTPVSVPKDEDGLLYDQETGFIKGSFSKPVFSGSPFFCAHLVPSVGPPVPLGTTQEM
jgi:hypothetical protein